ncbi:MAG: uL13 family ribosomal protein, partial [Chloroflexota bacterium]
MKTYAVKASEIERGWWVVDASDQTLGRLATRIATLLEGKHKPIYSPHLDTGDHV